MDSCWTGLISGSYFGGCSPIPAAQIFLLGKRDCNILADLRILCLCDKGMNISVQEIFRSVWMAHSYCVFALTHTLSIADERGFLDRRASLILARWCCSFGNSEPRW